LRLAVRFALLLLPLSSARPLVRVFRSVVEPLVLAMFNAGHDLSFGRAVAGKLVGDHDARRSHLLLQPLAQQPFGRLLVASTSTQVYRSHSPKALESYHPVTLHRFWIEGTLAPRDAWRCWGGDGQSLLPK